MTKIILGVLAGLVLGAAVTWTTLKRGEHEEDGAAAEDGHPEESRVLHTNDQTWIKLDKEAREKVGLQLGALEAVSQAPEVHAIGRVLDSAPLAALVIEMAAAHSALEASTKEFERLNMLARDLNTSARAIEVAAAARQRDQIAADAVQLKLVTSWGRAIVGQPDLPAFVRSLAAQEMALIRLDVPMGDSPKEPPTGARVAALNAPESVLDAQLLGSAPATDPQTQGHGFLCLVKGSSLAPGAALAGWLSLSGNPEQGVIVPRAAIVRHEGEAFLYLQMAEDLFLRKEVKLRHPAAKGWFVDDGFKPGDTVVIVGAQQLLSEELKGRGGEEE